MRIRVLALTLALVAAACSGSGSPVRAGTSGDPDTANGADGEAPFRLRDGSLLGAVLTTHPGDEASARPGLVFTTDDTEVAAVVALGEDVEAGSMITFTWSSVRSIDDREVLFTRDLEVGPGGTAVSFAVAEGGLAPGRYEVAAELGDAVVRLPWRVELARDADAGTTDAAGAAVEDWELPSPGESSWSEPTSTMPPPPPGPCEIAGLTTGFDPMRTADARATWIGTCSAMRLDAAVSGSPTTIASLETIAAGTLPELRGAVDLCELPGGSDLPGTTVRWTATGSDGASASESFLVPDLGETLMTEVASVPDPGQVEPGQRIALRGMALVMATALGVRELTLTVNDQPLVRVGNASEASSPEPCDDGRFGAVTYTHYDVPQDPPPVIEICGHAVGFDGTQADHCIAFSTVEEQTWTGTIHATNEGAECTGAEEGTITLSVAGEEVTGSFEAAGSYTCQGVTVATSGSGGFTGTFDGVSFTLGVTPPQGLLLATIACLVDRQPILVPVEGETASAHFRYTAPSGDVYQCDFALERAAGAG